MITNNLKKEIDVLLKNATELWFAVALAKDTTFDYIQNTVDKRCIQHYLIGIDLPTAPSVLKIMQLKQKPDLFESAIYKSNFNFHPKVYLIKSEQNYTAFIGSSNLTDGGFENNVELNYRVTSQEDCISILEWFNMLFNDGYPLSDENIKEYESQFESINATEEQLKMKRKFIQLKKAEKSVSILDGIDFTDRYFKKEHHLAFRKYLWLDSSFKAVKERDKTKDRFLELHSQIFPKFKDFGIEELDSNVKNHIVSMSYHLEGATTKELSAMWLSYGKQRGEIKEYKRLFPSVEKYKKSEDDDKQSFINHARLQIRLDYETIGIWLLFGKNNGGSLFDRQSFFKKMKEEKFKNEFYELIISLPSNYFISVSGVKKPCNTFSSSKQLHEFCKEDNIQKYFIIGRNYEINEEEMSESNLPRETLKVFKLLFPLYDLMRDKQFSNQ